MGGPAAGACPGCGQPVAAEDGFCEACGRDLYPITVSVGEPGHGGPCPVCGSRVGADGYCEQCGRKAPSGSDHVELDNGMLAGITDRGLRHRRNEDAMAIAATDTSAGPAAVAVVCDGVSTSARADEAALAAVGCAARARATRTAGWRTPPRRRRGRRMRPSWAWPRGPAIHRRRRMSRRWRPTTR